MKKIMLLSTIALILLSGCGEDQEEEKVEPVTVEESDQKAKEITDKEIDSKDNLVKDVKIKENTTYDLSEDMEEIEVPGVNLTDYINVKPNEKYIKNHGGYVFYFKKDKSFVKFEQLEEFPVEFTIPKGVNKIRMSIPTSQSDKKALMKIEDKKA